MLDKIKSFLTPFRIAFVIIALAIFFVVLFAGVVPTGLWWAYVVYFLVWIGLIFLFIGRKLFKR